MLEINVNVKEKGSFSVGDRITSTSSSQDYDTAHYLLKALFEEKRGHRFTQIRLLIYGRQILAEDGKIYDFRSWMALWNEVTEEVEIRASQICQVHVEEEISVDYEVG